MPAPIPPPSQSPPLRVNLPLPARRYVPGATPHPKTTPNRRGALSADASAETAFERGLDLLGHRFPWEAHEAMEHAWLIWRSNGDSRAELAGGLIKIAAAWLRHHGGHDHAARLLLQRARAQLAGAPATELDVAQLLTDTERFMAGGPWPQWPQADQAAR